MHPYLLAHVYSFGNYLKGKTKQCFVILMAQETEMIHSFMENSAHFPGLNVFASAFVCCDSKIIPNREKYMMGF